jgi:pyruvate dehydrogenase E1 component alpha subunit
LSDLAAPFGIPAQTVDGLDVEAVTSACSEAAAGVRDGAGPAFIELETIRLAAHSTNAREIRSKMELAELHARCPLRRQAERLRDEGVLDRAAEAALETWVAARVAQAMAFADASPPPSLEEALADVW